MWRELVLHPVVGPLAAMVVFAEKCRLRPVRIWVDDAGSVAIWSKGYINFCRLCSVHHTGEGDKCGGGGAGVPGGHSEDHQVLDPKGSHG